MSNSTSFDVVPTEDGAGYWVKICSEERCCQAFVSSMHMADGKRPQLLSCLHDSKMVSHDLLKKVNLPKLSGEALDPSKQFN